ncbi:MAG: class I SAM-dependent methyltransferase [Leptolyngbya sp. SIO1D8]|nr:class I SAM-dependent methyltransferase [Leptolyngbya sp. SIO1D8]
MCDFWKRWQYPQLHAPPESSLAFEHRWSQYYQAVEGRPPRETLVKALNFFEAENPHQQSKSRRLAVDLGCGSGRDTVELLRRGWRVIAIDGQAEAIARLRQHPDINRTYLETRVQPFENLTLPPEVDLINASFCLPFCPVEYFSDLWEAIVTALKPGGRFCGQLFGDRDSWSLYSNLNCHTREQVEELFSPFEFDFFDEEEHPGKTVLGEEKHWHIFQIVARR